MRDVLDAITYLASDGVEQGVNDSLREPALLVLVHLNDLAPVSSDLGQVQALAKVDEVEDILLETRATEANGCTEEFGADSGVVTDGMRNFVNVGTCSLADGRQCVD